MLTETPFQHSTSSCVASAVSNPTNVKVYKLQVNQQQQQQQQQHANHDDDSSPLLSFESATLQSILSPSSTADRMSDTNNKVLDGLISCTSSRITSTSTTSAAARHTDKHVPLDCFVQTNGHMDQSHLLCINSTLHESTSSSSSSSFSSAAVMIDLSQLFHASSSNQKVILNDDDKIQTSCFVFQSSNDNNNINNNNTTNNNSSSEPSILKITIVDSNIRILSLQLHLDRKSAFHDVDNYNDCHDDWSLSLFHVEYIPSPHIINNNSNDSNNRDPIIAPTVQFISHNQIIYIHPTQHTICNYHFGSTNTTNTYHTNTNTNSTKLVMWKTFTECLEFKKQSLGYLTCAKGLLVGKSALDLVVNDDNDDESNNNDEKEIGHDETQSQDDLIPCTIAICTMSDFVNATNNTTSSHNNPSVKGIASLHEDGKIRVWTLLPTSTTSNSHSMSKMKMYPLNVRTLQQNHSHPQSLNSNIMLQQFIQLWNQENNIATTNGTMTMMMKGTFLSPSILSSSSKSIAGRNQQSMIEFDDDDDEFYDNDEERLGYVSLYLQSILSSNNDDDDNNDNVGDYNEQPQSLTLYSFDMNNHRSTGKHHVVTRTNLHDLIVPLSSTCNDDDDDDVSKSNNDRIHAESMIDMGYTIVQEKFQLCTMYNSQIAHHDDDNDDNDDNSNNNEEEEYGTYLVDDSIALDTIQFGFYDIDPSTVMTASSSIISPQLIDGADDNRYFLGVGTTIDSVTLQQRKQCILQCNLFLEDGLNQVNNNTNNEESFMAMLQLVDAWYMKKLYQSKDIASHFSIHRALETVIPLHIYDRRLDTDDATPIQIMTITLMRKWIIASLKESNQTMDVEMSPPAMIGEGGADSATVMMRMMMMDDDEKKESTIDCNEQYRYINHHSKWFELLLAVCDEEARLQRPLAFISKSSYSNGVGTLLRKGCASSLSLVDKPNGEAYPNPIDGLDYLATLISQEFSKDSLNESILVGFEMKIWNIIAKASLVFTEEAKAVDSLIQDLVKTIDANMWYDIGLQVSTIMKGMSTDEVNKWLSSPLSSAFANDSCLGNVSVMNGTSGPMLSPDNIASIAPFTETVARNCLDRISHFALFRCILVKGVQTSHTTKTLFGVNEVKYSIRTFLQTTSILWIHTQLTTTSTKESDGRLRVKFSPTKKSKIEGNISRMTGVSTVFTSLLKKLIAKGNLFSSSNHIGLILATAKMYIQALYQGSGYIPVLLQDIPNFKRLSIRLLAPYVSYPKPSCGNQETIQLNGMVAEGMLAEVDGLVVSKCITMNDAKKLLSQALAFLVPTNDDVSSSHSDKNTMEAFFTTMMSFSDEPLNSNTITVNQFNEDYLLKALTNILDAKTRSITEADVKKLANLDTMRKIMMPCIMTSQLQGLDPLKVMIQKLSNATSNPQGAIKSCIGILFRISTLMNHVTVIERHCVTTTNAQLKILYSEIIHCAINQILQEIQNHFTSTTCHSMSEYAALWSLAFRHAIVANEWDSAFQACISNPLKERRVKNFKRLVLAMVEAGALNKLINKIVFTVMDWHSSDGIDIGDDDNDDDESSANKMDLYELACETLAQSAVERSKFRLDQLEPTSVNYQGCLYALHASHKNWKRCCQVMDLYGIISNGHLKDAKELSLTESDEKKVDEKILNDIVLSSVASSQFIQLIPDPSQRYIIAGEVSPYTPLVALSSALSLASSITKGDDHTSGNGRVSRLLTEENLSLRATRSMALRTLFFDALSPESLLDIIDCSDKQYIEALSRLGYYSHVLAIAHCKNEELNGACPGGRNVLVDSISHMICQYMLPNTMKQLQSSHGGGDNGNDNDNDNGIDQMYVDEESDGIEHRPTLTQLRLESGGSGSLPIGCELWRKDSMNSTVDRASIAMKLVHRFTSMYAATGQNNSFLASEVAETILDLDRGCSELPFWLHDLCMGSITNATNNAGAGAGAATSGLFAKCGGSGSGGGGVGNPTDLIRLYMKYGMLSNACKVVHDILEGGSSSSSGSGSSIREELATKRLPEKGCIDFVPYAVIDQLWNMIETYVQSTSSGIIISEADVVKKESLLKDRNAMEHAIEKHLELMKISEMGLLSARALTI